MGLSKEAIKELKDIYRKKLSEGLSDGLQANWEQVSTEDAELRIQQAFEMLLGEELRLTNYAHPSPRLFPRQLQSGAGVQSGVGATVDRCSLEDYNQDNERSTITLKGNCHVAKNIRKYPRSLS